MSFGILSQSSFSAKPTPLLNSVSAARFAVVGGRTAGGFPAAGSWGDGLSPHPLSSSRVKAIDAANRRVMISSRGMLSGHILTSRTPHAQPTLREHVLSPGTRRARGGGSVRFLGDWEGPHERMSLRLAHSAALSIARIASRIAGGSVPQDSITLARSGSIGPFSRSTAPDFAPLVLETYTRLGEFSDCSSPLLGTKNDKRLWRVIPPAAFFHA